MSKKPNKRIRKKQARRQIINSNPNVSSKMTFAELLNVENERRKKEERSQRRREKEQRWLSFLESEADRIGYKGKVYKSWKLDRLYAEREKEKKRERAERRRALIESKYQYLITNGIDAQAARKIANKNYSWDKTREFVTGQNRIHYTGGSPGGPWMGVCWADTSGESDLRGAYAECKSLTLEEEIILINENYQYFMSNLDNTDGMRGIAFVCIGETEAEMNKQMELAKIRGYGNQVSYNFVRLAGSNRFTAKGYADILYICLANSSGVNAIKTYDRLQAFAAEYLPEIYAIIFNDF